MQEEIFINNCNNYLFPGTRYIEGVHSKQKLNENKHYSVFAAISNSNRKIYVTYYNHLKYVGYVCLCDDDDLKEQHEIILNKFDIDFALSQIADKGLIHTKIQIIAGCEYEDVIKSGFFTVGNYGKNIEVFYQAGGFHICVKIRNIIPTYSPTMFYLTDNSEFIDLLNRYGYVNSYKY